MASATQPAEQIPQAPVFRCTQASGSITGTVVAGTVASPDSPVVLFDGYCNLCSGWVDFVIRHGEERPIRFVPLQSEAYRSGYSLEGLRDLELVRLETEVARNGSYLHQSIQRLFRLIHQGAHHPDLPVIAAIKDGIDHGFRRRGIIRRSGGGERQS